MAISVEKYLENRDSKIASWGLTKFREIIGGETVSVYPMRGVFTSLVSTMNSLGLFFIRDIKKARQIRAF